MAGSCSKFFMCTRHPRRPKPSPQTPTLKARQSQALGRPPAPELPNHLVSSTFVYCRVVATLTYYAELRTRRAVERGRKKSAAASCKGRDTDGLQRRDARAGRRSARAGKSAGRVVPPQCRHARETTARPVRAGRPVGRSPPLEKPPRPSARVAKSSHTTGL